MKSSSCFVHTSLILAASVFAVSAALASDQNNYGNDGGGKIVTVAFGIGLNTAQPGNAQNHHVLPDVIKVRVGDVVSFNVAGLHIIRVYDDGVKLGDLRNVIPDECETNPAPGTPFPPTCFLSPPAPPVIPQLGLPVYYEGLNSIAGPPPLPPFTSVSTAQNRIEPVAFLKEGRFLVICAVLPHFNDNMYAWVEVKERHDRD
jgi:plastocyanin